MNTEWKLDDFFYEGVNDRAIMDDVDSYVRSVDDFTVKYQNRISNLSHDAFLEYLGDWSNLGMVIEKISMYLGLAMSLNTQDQGLQKLAKKLQKIGAECSEKLVFIQEANKMMGYDRLISLSQKKEFERYKNFLVNEANSLKYLLDETEESLLIKSDQASEENIYEELTSVFEFPFKGEMLTQDEVRSKRESPNRNERAEAVRSMGSVFGSQERQIVFGNLYALVCKANVFDKEIRGYDSVLSSRNESEQISDQAVDTLIGSVTKKYPYFHTFLEKKRRVLGLETMEFHDVLAPIDDLDQEKLTFEKGWSMFMDVIKKADPLQHEFMNSMLNEGRISVYPRNGKSTGAFANYGAFTKEFMMLNWADSPNDVTTLAHEAGHCIHGHLSKVQDPLVYHTPLTLAETASIFNETLMFEELIKNVDPERKSAMIMARLDDIFSTIFRQIAYIRFERRCHEAFERNEPMTYEDFNAAWLEEFALLFGPNVKLNENEVSPLWSSVPHISQTPFYCYTYAFGNIISLNLVQQYKQAEDKVDFMKKYHSFLAAGGSERPEDLLMSIFGLKIDEQFYETALRNIVELMEMVDETEIAA